MRRKTSVPEIRESSSHKEGFITQQTVHHNETRMDTDEGTHHRSECENGVERNQGKDIEVHVAV